MLNWSTGLSNFAFEYINREFSFYGRKSGVEIEKLVELSMDKMC